MRDFSHFEEHFWTGEFYTSPDIKDKLSGKLTYSPGSGLSVEILVSNRDNFPRLETHDLLYGHIYNDNEITKVIISLFFSLGSMNSFVFKDNMRLTSYKIHAEWALLGSLDFNRGQTFSHASLQTNRANHLYDFRGFLNKHPNESRVLNKAKIDDYTYQIKYNEEAMYSSLKKAISIISNEDLSECPETQSYIDAITNLTREFENKKKVIVATKKKPYVTHSIDFNKNKNVSDITYIIRSLCNLYTFLNKSIFAPKVVNLTYKEKENVSTCRLLISHNYMSHHLEEINYEGINRARDAIYLNDLTCFEKTLQIWNKKDFILDSIKDFLFYNTYSPNSSLSKFKDISCIIEHIGRKKSEKGDYFQHFLNYCNNKVLLDELKENVPDSLLKKCDSLGYALKELRNFAIHPLNFEKKIDTRDEVKKYFNETNFGNISEILSYILFIYFAKTIGVKEEKVNLLVKNAHTNVSKYFDSIETIIEGNVEE
ncbi:MAG: hypothetical protein GY909_15370 [Oligoflexia bacterium]|nr:hypothetical protein [Oligoflexia bacterium]